MYLTFSPVFAMIQYIEQDEVFFMKISAKGRYGLTAMTYLAKQYESAAPVTILSISNKFDISKIYLEQVFSILKRSHLVVSIKGSQGGYRLAKKPSEISVYDILSSIELFLTEKTMPITEGKVPALDRAIEARVYAPLEENIKKSLASVSLDDILSAVAEETSPDNLMYFI